MKHPVDDTSEIDLKVLIVICIECIPDFVEIKVSNM